MHRMGGVSRSVKFSLAGNSEAIAAAIEREAPLSITGGQAEFFDWGGNLAGTWLSEALTFALENIPL